MRILLLLTCLIIFLFLLSCNSKEPEAKTKNSPIAEVAKEAKFATYNVAMFRDRPGQLKRDLSSGRDTQIQNVAAVIQRVRPDVLVLCEFDYDSEGRLLDLFEGNYLAKGQHGEQAIRYPYRLAFPSNTGVLSPADFDGDGAIKLPNDAYGFGRYEGQYAFAILSKYPIDDENLLSYQEQRWADIPDAKIPVKENGKPYYDQKAWDVFRISSKNHVTIPIRMPAGKIIHTVIAHPTPPVFDGPEDKNGLRNYDEIRLLKDIVNNESYLKSDQGKRGGLQDDVSFVVLGDLNADPIDGDSAPGAISQLLDDPKINQTVSNGNLIPKSKGGKIYNRRKTDKADPAFDTAFFGARIDYVLPSKNLKATNSGVFWPAEDEDLYDIVKNKKASDHLLVWVTVEL